MAGKFLLDLDPELMQSAKGRLKNFLDKPYGWPIALFVILTVVSAVVIASTFWYKPKVLRVSPIEKYFVTVRHDDRSQTVPTDARTVGQFLNRMQIQIGKGDRVEPALDQEIDTDNFRINVYRSAPIAIIEDGRQVLVNTAAATPRNAVERSGMPLYPEDKITAGLTSNFLTQGSIGYRAVVDRAALVKMTLYGQPLEVRTHAKTIGDLLKEKNVKLTDKDTVKPGLDARVADGLTLAVIRDGIQTIIVEEDIPAPLQTVVDGLLAIGSQAVRQEGSPGRVANTYEIKVENGEEVSRRIVQSVRIVEPVPRIVARGNSVNIPSDKRAVLAAAGISPNDYGYVDYIFTKESRWNAAALNSRGCAGLGQSCPEAKLAASCPDWRNDPVCQTRWFSGYAVGRYGSWEGAYNAWLSKRWW